MICPPRLKRLIISHPGKREPPSCSSSVNLLLTGNFSYLDTRQFIVSLDLIYLPAHKEARIAKSPGSNSRKMVNEIKYYCPNIFGINTNV